jgi:hypothetical protein
MNMSKDAECTGQVPSELPSPEPPPINNATTTEIDWTTDIINTISNNDKIFCKPATSAKIIFDQKQPVSELSSHIHTCTDNIPVTYCDSDNTILDMRMLDDNFGNMDDNTSMFGEILTGDAMENQNIVNDPILNILKKKNIFIPDKWHPNLNAVIEEKVYDIDAMNGVPCIIPKTLTSGKKRRQWHNKMQSKYNDSKANISKALSKHGLYPIQITSAQNDGGANRSVTASKDLLVHYKDIEDNHLALMRMM